MANGFKTGGSDFKEGDERINRAGRPPVPSELKSARKLNKVELEAIFNKYVYADQFEIDQILNSPYAPMIDRMVCRVIHIAVTRGSWKHFEFLLNRLIGKVADAPFDTEALTVELKYKVGDKPQYRQVENNE